MISDLLFHPPHLTHRESYSYKQDIMDSHTCNESYPLAGREQNGSSNYESTMNEPAVPSSHTNYKVGSLDFERVINSYSIEAIRKRFHTTRPTQHVHTQTDLSSSFRRRSERRRSLFGFTGRTATRWALTVVASLLTGLTSIGLVICTSSVVSWRECS